MKMLFCWISLVVSSYYRFQDEGFYFVCTQISFEHKAKFKGIPILHVYMQEVLI